MFSFLELSRLTVAAAAALVSVGASAQTAWLGLTTDNRLVQWSADFSSMSSQPITGLASGESLLGIDLRPSNGLVYAIGTTNTLYTLDTATGQASFVTALTGANLAMAGGLGIDFNPVADYAGNASLRVTTGGGNNYAVNAGTGVVGNTASNIGPGHTGAAYTNSRTGQAGMAPTSTALYYINTATDQLEMAPGAFNAPNIQAVGPLGLGLDVLSANGFDIGADGMAVAALNLDDGSGRSRLYRINLMSGAATELAAFNGTLVGLTQVTSPVPEPSTLALVGFGLGCVALSRRRQRPPSR